MTSTSQPHPSQNSAESQLLIVLYDRTFYMIESIESRSI